MEMIKKNKSRYDSIDGMRLVMALMVALLHVGMPLGFCEKYMCDVARNAVPFFYICSGFFIYSLHYGIVNGRIKSLLKKNDCLLGVYNVVLSGVRIVTLAGF